jgi:hypothetical protein
MSQPNAHVNRSAVTDAVQILSLGAGVTAAVAGIGVGAVYLGPPLGVTAAVGFGLVFLIKWMRALKVNEDFVGLLDYMYAYNAYIKLVGEQYQADPQHAYLVDVMRRMKTVVDRLQNSVFNQPPNPGHTLYAKAEQKLNQLVTTGKLWVTAQDVRMLENLITTASHECQFLMMGVSIYVAQKQLAVDKINFNFYVQPDKIPDVTAYDLEKNRIEFKTHITPSEGMLSRVSAFGQNLLWGTGGTRSKKRRSRQTKNKRS